LLERVHPDATSSFGGRMNFRRGFGGSVPHFVLSVDIRRSTELMLKARTAEKFAEFITGLSIELTTIVLNSFGVFDKLTGDGILAFFPDFFSGPDAAYRVVAAFVNALIRFGCFSPPRSSANCRKNTQGMIWPPLRSACFVSSWRCSSIARTSSVMMNTRPSRFFVVPASSRTSPLLKSTWRHWSGSTSLAMRQPVT
jgi:hypothetical protein